MVTAPAQAHRCPPDRCRSCEMRRAWAEGRMKPRPPRFIRGAWFPEHDARLRELLGHAPHLIAAALNAEFGTTRSTFAVQGRCRVLGLSAYHSDWTAQDIGTLLGSHLRTIIAHLLRPGLLPSTRYSAFGPPTKRAMWIVREADLEAFLRTHGWAYDWQRMTPGHRLTRLAELAAKADPWVRWSEALRYLKLTDKSGQTWRRRGLLPVRQRLLGHGGYGRLSLVRRADLPGIAESIAAARAKAVRAALDKAVATNRAKGAARRQERAA